MTDLTKLKEMSPLEKACAEIIAVREEREREEQEQKTRWRSPELSAVRTLEALGYTYHRGEMWKPPIGKAPDFDLIDSLRAEVERLRNRLEISDKHPYDGIACRDETIKGLQRIIDGRWRPEVERLEAENEALKDKLSDCAISLHGEMMQKYGGQSPEDMHPVTRRDYERDIAEIAEYTAALEGGGK